MGLIDTKLPKIPSTPLTSASGYSLTGELATGSSSGSPSAAATQTSLASPENATAAPVAQTPANVVSVQQPAPATARQITSDETVSGQLNKLLSADSTYLQSARTRGLETANSRGLINSSLAAGTAERAAIDAALPIAQQDSTVNANAGQSAQQANQDMTLTSHKSLLDSAQQAENFRYRTKENEQNIAANTALQNDRIALDQQRLEADKRDKYNSAASPIIQQTLSEISQIQRTPDSVMSPEAKRVAIEDLTARKTANLKTIATLYDFQLDWPVDDLGPEATAAQASRDQAQIAANAQAKAAAELKAQQEAEAAAAAANQNWG